MGYKGRLFKKGARGTYVVDIKLGRKSIEDQQTFMYLRATLKKYFRQQSKQNPCTPCKQKKRES